MKAPAFKSILATAIRYASGDAHIIVQSMADGIVRFESKLVNKLTKESRHDIEKQRHQHTVETQELVKATTARAVGFIGAIFKASTKPLVSGENINFEEGQTIYAPESNA